MLIDLEDKVAMAGAAAYTGSVRIDGIGLGGKVRDDKLDIRSLNNAWAVQARMGKWRILGVKPYKVPWLKFNRTPLQPVFV